MQEAESIFLEIKSLYDQRSPHPGGLICKQGNYYQCTVLKLQKPTWTNDPMDCVRNETGIFFSLWIADKIAPKQRLNYNIHALKLRHLRGYKIASRDFATEFRSQFASRFASRSASRSAGSASARLPSASFSSVWPNLRLDYGPLTLMQGWIEFDTHPLNPDALKRQMLDLMLQFEAVCPILDQMLEARRVHG